MYGVEVLNLKKMIKLITIYTPEQLAEVKTQKEQEVGMYVSEIEHLQERKAKLEAEILEITNLL